ncbi:MAG: tRNA pseudouridine(13) synthase TruD [Desulfurococcales archaeon]|nr:tRNA pseudouridine(13) synthase TruD [Desulfurococcales archaeon]
MNNCKPEICLPILYGWPPKKLLPCKVKRFVVAEIHSRKPYQEGINKGNVYFVHKRSGVETGFILNMLSTYRANVYGIKDRHAEAFFYMTTEKPLPELSGILSGIKYWYLGRGKLARLGGHDGNLFRIHLACDHLQSVKSFSTDTLFFPNFYGPQRFGMVEPNTHILGDFILTKWYPGLLLEFLRGARRGGWFEKRLFKSIKRRYLITMTIPGMLNRLFEDAYYSFLYNLILSKLIPNPGLCEKPDECLSNKDLIQWKSHTLFGKQFILPHVNSSAIGELSLFGNDGCLAFRRIAWLVKKRPIVAPVLSYNVKIKGGGSIVMSFKLPPGSYATVVGFSAGFFLVY